MKLALLKDDKKTIFFQFFENLLSSINVGFAWVLGIDKDIIWINNNKNIKFFDQDLIDITLETSRCIEESKRYYLVLEVAVLSLKDLFLFIALFYLHLIVSICEVKLDELFGLS